MTRRTTCWIAWGSLALLGLAALASPGCRARGNVPANPVPLAAASAAAETLPDPPSTPTPAPSVTLALLGDVMLGRDVHPNSETFAYLEPFLASTDLALANLESPLTNFPARTGSPYALCAPPENARYLAEAGLDLLALANNHRLDCGAAGLVETQSTLTGHGLGFIGPGPEPVRRSIHGVELAFLAFDATARFDLEEAAQAVRSAREAGDIVVVSIHWGAEYQAGASTGQKQIAGRLAEAGAALIWGHHPHVLQPAERIGDGKPLVLYSLGNALFDQHGLADTRRSALVLVTLDPGGLQEFDVIPFVIDVQNSRVLAAGQRDAQLILQYFNKNHETEAR